MEGATTLIAAVSALLWPVIVIGALAIFRSPMKELILSAKSRKFTIKIGGQELTMDEATEQQAKLIGDLQSQITEIRALLARTNPVEVRAQPAFSGPQVRELSSVLWVDDEPKNNSYFVEELGRLGVRVDLARTTSEGLSKAGNRRYSVIISDMGRREDGKDNFRAGLDFLKTVRETDSDIPFIIFCSSRGVREHQEEAMRLGANGITASATELSEFLNLARLKKEA